MANRRAPVPHGAPVALTGTPGVGKSTVARVLRSRFRVEEVGDLARRFGAARSSPHGLVVDLGRLRRKLARGYGQARIDLVVGHLAHLLPVRSIVVLRCHPLELRTRLARARRGTVDERRANLVAEATDIVLSEALREGRRVYEVDTSGRSPAAVAREVARRVRAPGPSRYGTVDWLSDRRVTEHLLERAA